MAVVHGVSRLLSPSARWVSRVPGRLYSVTHMSVPERIEKKRSEALQGGGLQRIEAQHKRVRRAQCHPANQDCLQGAALSITCVQRLMDIVRLCLTLGLDGDLFLTSRVQSIADLIPCHSIVTGRTWGREHAGDKRQGSHLSPTYITCWGRPTILYCFYR